MTPTPRPELGQALLDELRAIRAEIGAVRLLLERDGRELEGERSSPRSPRAASLKEPSPAALAAAKAAAEERRQKLAEEQGEKVRQAAAWSSRAAWEAERAVRRAGKEQRT